MILPDDFYFRAGDKENFLQKLSQQLSEPYSSVHYNLSDYQWESIAAQTAAIYQGLTDNNHSSQ
jgi:hypothetical protein